MPVDDMYNQKSLAGKKVSLMFTKKMQVGGIAYPNFFMLHQNVQGLHTSC